MGLKCLLMKLMDELELTYGGSMCDVHLSLTRLPVPPKTNNKKMEKVEFEIRHPFDWNLANRVINKKIDGKIYVKSGNNSLPDQPITSINTLLIDPNKPLIKFGNCTKIVKIEDLYISIRLHEKSVAVFCCDKYNYDIAEIEEIVQDEIGQLVFKCSVSLCADGTLKFNNTYSLEVEGRTIRIATEEEIQKFYKIAKSVYPGPFSLYAITSDSEPATAKIATPEDKLSELDKKYLRIAYIWAENSYCTRRKVGAIIVKDKMIISDGYNGTPAGFENVCELDDGTTKPYVLHAEANAITKLAKSHNSSEGATLYVTTSPCMECSKLIIQAGIRRVVYCEEYSHKEGLEILKKAGVELVQITDLK